VSVRSVRNKELEKALKKSEQFRRDIEKLEATSEERMPRLEQERSQLKEQIKQIELANRNLTKAQNNHSKAL
jgi:flagellar motility protein MotE (MotC chaperone)